jgi:hypothetical protein
LARHAAFVGCLFDGLEQQLYGMALAFATAAAFCLDIGRLAILALGEVAGLLGDGLAVIGWLLSFVTALVSAMSTASATQAEQMPELAAWHLFVASYAPLQLFLAGSAAVGWVRIGLWVLREVSRLANG